MRKKDLLVCSMTQEQLAFRLGVSQPMVSKWFSGRTIPRIDTIDRICKVLEIPHQELIDFIYAKNLKLVELSKKQKRSI
jgi:transcriptional regulator with XRE-family HTH domain